MKTKKIKKRKKTRNVNRVPGQVVYVGNRQSMNTAYELISYNESGLTQKDTGSLKKVWASWSEDKVNWLTINGLSDLQVIKEIGERFKLHPLVLEDIANTQQRAKFDEYSDYLFLVIKVLFPMETGYDVEPIRLVMGNDYLLCFQETEHPLFDLIKDRIEKAGGQVRGKGPDYLLFLLLDSILNNYLLVIDEIGGTLDNLESQIFSGKTNEEIIRAVQKLKPEVLEIRRISTPLREIVKKLEASKHPFIQTGTFNYYRDLNDLTLELADTIEINRETLLGIMEMYLSSLNNNMNQVMKILTIIATIFIPLTFITGIYGMNFENMPELSFRYGYYYVLGLMVLIVSAMLLFFRRKGWL